MNLIKTEDFLHIIEETPVSIVVTDVDANIIYVNSKFTSITGYTKEEVVGQNPRILQSGKHSPEFYKEMWDTLTSKQEWEGEIINKRKNGEIFYESAKIKPILNESGDIVRYVGIKEDITEKKQLKEKLSNEEKNLIIAQISMGIAHEFNNILSVIKSIVQLDLFYFDSHFSNMSQNKQSINMKTDLLSIEEQVNRGARLVSEFMQLGRSVHLQFKKTYLTKLIDEIIEMERGNLAKEKIKISKNYSYKHPIVCDPDKISQVILNLLINARHAIKPKGSGLITISLEKDVNDVLIKISDTGIGIKKKDTEKIFAPFFTTKSAYSKDNTKLKGSGLGLALSKKIIEQHQGSLSFTSKEGEGTTFTINLPIKKDTGEFVTDTHKTEIKPTNKSTIFNDIKILLVDDEEQILKNSTKYLQSIGVKNIFKAKSGEESLDILQKNEIDIVFLNIILPQMSGEEVYEKMIQISPSVKIIFSTGKINTSPRNFLSKKNVYGFLKKPFDFSDMHNILKELIN